MVRLRKGPRQAGFTLVELIVVVAIMGLGLSVFLGLNYRQRESFRWRTSLRELKVFLKLARSYAVLEHRANPCYYEPGPRLFTESLRRRQVRLPPGVELVLSEEQQARLAQLETQPEAGGDKTDGEKSKKPRSGRLRLAIFYADGGAGGGSLRLKAGDRRARLVIDPLTGAVKIVEQKAEDVDAEGS